MSAEANSLPVLLCPRDGGKVVELKDDPEPNGGRPGDGEPIVTGYWCEEGHKLEPAEKPLTAGVDDGENR